VCAALVGLGWLENDHALHAEGVLAVRDVLQCSQDDAKTVLRDLRVRNVIDVATTTDDRKPTPTAQLRWVRPPAQI